MLSRFLLIFFFISCSTEMKKAAPTEQKSPVIVKEFSRGELILATDFLSKIYDQEMAPVECVPDTSEAALLLRTIRPRAEVVIDDTEAMLDNPKEIQELINTCDQNCTCYYVDELFREHEITLTKSQKNVFNKKKSASEINRCFNYIKSTFCQSDLFRVLDSEKADFRFDDP